MTHTLFSLFPVIGLALTLSTPAAIARSKESPKISCPDTALGETAVDCPWAGVARMLIAKAESGQGAGEREVGPLLRKHLPDLDRALQSDSRRSSWKNLWGRSVNFDELANGIIVHPSILQAIDERFGSHAPLILDHIKAESIKGIDAAKMLGGTPSVTDPAGHPLAHAGMEHTYGYLFSVLKTSFGYKRARWVEGEIEKGFGLKPGLFGPRPEGGTLFANVTYFIGHIAFRADDKKIAALNHGAERLPAELRKFDFTQLSPIRLEETVEGKDTAGLLRKVILRTDLVPFLHPHKNTHLLVYSVEDPSDGGHVLISTFPVAASFVDSVMNPENLGEGKPVITRYNAFVEGITGQKLTGTRKKAATP